MNDEADRQARQDAAARKRIAEYQQPMNRELEMLKLWPELVEALERELMCATPSNKSKRLLERARALGDE